MKINYNTRSIAVAWDVRMLHVYTGIDLNKRGRTDIADFITRVMSGRASSAS